MNLEAARSKPWLFPPSDYMPVYAQGATIVLVGGVDTLVLTFRSSLVRRTRIAALGFFPIPLAAGLLVRFEGSPAVGDLAAFRPATFQPAVAGQGNQHEIPIYLNLPAATELRVFAQYAAGAKFSIRLVGWEYSAP